MSAYTTIHGCHCHSDQGDDSCFACEIDRLNAELARLRALCAGVDGPFLTPVDLANWAKKMREAGRGEGHA